MENISSKINSTHNFDRSSLVVLLLTFLILPFVFLGNTSAIPLELVKIFILSVGILTSLILWAIARLRDKTLLIPQGIIFYSFLGVCLIFILSSIFSGSFLFSFIGYGTESTASGFWMLGAILVFLSSSLFSNRGNLVFVSRVLGFGAGLLVLFAFVSGVLRVFGTDKMYNPVGLWSDTVIIMGLVTLVLAYMIPHLNLSLTKKVIGYIFLALCLATTIITGLYFTVFWYVMAAFAAILILASFQPEPQTAPKALSGAKRFPFLLAILLAISIFVAVVPGTIAKINPKYFSAPFTDSLSSTWTITKEIGVFTIEDRPILGTGANTYLRQFLLHRPTTADLSSLRNVDFWYGVGIVPTLLATTGILGILALLFFLGTLILKSASTLFLKNSDYSFSSLSLQIRSICVSALFLWTMITIHASGVVVVVLAILMTSLYINLLSKDVKNKTIKIETSRLKFGKIFLSIFIILVLLPIVLYATGVGRRLVSAVYFAQALSIYKETKDVPATEKMILKSVSSYPADAYYRALAELQAGYLGTLINSTDASIDKTSEEFKDKAITAFKKSAQYAHNAVEADPKNYLNHMTLGKLAESSIFLGVKDGFQTAHSAYSEALKLNPSEKAIADALNRLSDVNATKSTPPSNKK